MMIDIQEFTKTYGDFLAVDHLKLQVEKGDIYGLIGPNGAGKTTTFRFLSTLLEPTSGDALLNGFSVSKQVRDVRRSIGYMPDNFGVYDGMRVWEFLDFFAVAYGLPRAKRLQVIDDVLLLVDLMHKRGELVNGLSRGMRQRLCLAKTLVHDPPVLILDEPASGLDPRARIEMKEMLHELRRMGKTIIVSSHILSELADYCNKIAIMERGKLLAAGEVKTILEQIRKYRVIEISVLARGDDVEALLKCKPGVSSLARENGTLRMDYAGTSESLVDIHREIVEQGIPLLWFREVEANLEEAFLKLTRGEVG